MFHFKFYKLISIFILLSIFILKNDALVYAQTGPAISNITDNRASYPNGQIPKYEKLEITFQVQTNATNLQLPYDANPPNGITPLTNPKHKGVSVDAQFIAPDGSTYNQPGFYYYYYNDTGSKPGWTGSNYNWAYPTGKTAWKVRFSPNQVGNNWQYRLLVKDSSGNTQSDLQSFTVSNSSNKGFIKISPTDPRYFEFQNGELFNPYGVNNSSISSFSGLSQNGMKLTRNWYSTLYGESWPEWLGNRNQYVCDGCYLPITGYLPINNVNNNPVATIRIDYEASGDIGWFDACRLQDWNRAPEAVKPNTNYKLKIIYFGAGINGPRNIASANYGIVGKITTNWLGWNGDECYNSASSYANVTNYGHNTANSWGTLEGNWNSGSNNFLPRIYVALENVLAAGDTFDTKALASILSISLREDLGNGQFGPEIIEEYSAESESYFPDKGLYTLDKELEVAKQNDMYMKIVLMDKDDHIYRKMNDNGTFVISGNDNDNGFYGCDSQDNVNPPGTCPFNGRTVNKTRWLQNAYYRYLQARFGYSPNIHSWELTNEGDPWNRNHWEMTDELGKFMHCGVFGVAVGSGDGTQCTIKHPNAHMVTTSFWTSFPGYTSTSDSFWGSPKYKNVDYADVHAYITTSEASTANKALMEKDSAFYHLWASQAYGTWGFAFPVVRGEAGMTPANGSTNDGGVLGIQNDTTGVWFHNYVWAGLDSGALYELYWYTDHIYNSSYDHRPIFVKYLTFLQNVPLANGKYKDIAATSTNTNLRTVGQKDTVNNRAHLWVANLNYTWKNVVDNVTISPESGTITISGFTTTNPLKVEKWNTWTAVVESTSYIAPVGGVLTLPAISNLTTDLAYKIGDYTNINPSPSPSTTPQPSPSPQFTVAELKTLIGKWLGIDTDYYFSDNKVNALDAAWVIKWLVR